MAPYLEWIGNYDPMADPPAMSLKVDRAVQWLSHGAQPSDAVRRILDKNGISKNGSVVEVAAVPPAAEAPEAEEPDAPTAQAEVDDATEAVEQQRTKLLPMMKPPPTGLLLMGLPLMVLP